MRGSLKKVAITSSPRVRSIVVKTAATAFWSGRRSSRSDLARLRRLPIEKGIAAQKIQALVQVERVSKRYATAIALDELTLDVFEGETLGLLGPNGAGKTTLMHLLAGLLRPDTGSVRIAGLGDPQSRRVRAAIGLAPQELAVYPQLSAEENLRFFGRLYGLRGVELQAGVEKALRLADLTARAGERTGTFSGGMKRRLNLACALVHRPTLLLLDEPTAGVDPHSRNRLFEVIERLKSEGLTLVYSTHLMEEPERLCDRVAIIDHGHLLAVGTAPQLVARYGAADLHALFLALTGSEVRD
jgi:linearmycin/streptolysin S transport system ATP-binding protein